MVCFVDDWITSYSSLFQSNKATPLHQKEKATICMSKVMC
jgi:hypothetical protein